MESSTSSSSNIMSSQTDEANRNLNSSSQSQECSGASNNSAPSPDFNKDSNILPDVSGSGNDEDSHGIQSDKKKTVPAMLVVGMAGSGKTTLCQRLSLYMEENNIESYTMNLDPAVGNVPYSCNIDIRDSVKYENVMKQYDLGPNGAIMTSLNLFATQFDQVVKFVEKKLPVLDYVLVDTPGQIEVFTWSASGSIITESLAVTMPCVLVYVVDTPRTTSPVTFMSNMLYACSIMYKTKLPLVVVFNKNDVVSHEFAQEWMTDFDAFQEALQQSSDQPGNRGESYIEDLTRSMSLVLDQFYREIKSVGVSAATGDGLGDFFHAVDVACEEYTKNYLPEIQRRIELQQQTEKDRRIQELEKLKKTMKQEEMPMRTVEASSKISDVKNAPKD